MHKEHGLSLAEMEGLLRKAAIDENTKKALVKLGLDMTAEFSAGISDEAWEMVEALQVEPPAKLARPVPSHGHETGPNGDLTRKAVAELAFKIIELLNGVPVGEAQYVLDETKVWLLDSHVVDTSNQRYAAKVRAARGSDASAN